MIILGKKYFQSFLSVDLISFPSIFRKKCDLLIFLVEYVYKYYY